MSRSTMQVRPTTPKTETLAYLTIVGEGLRVQFAERREDFRGLLRSLGFTWDRGCLCWRRQLDAFNGPAPDRAAETGRALLAAGFVVVFPNEDLAHLAVEGTFTPEQKRWVLADGGRFRLIWRRSEDCYKEAMKLSGARYQSGGIRVPAEHYDEVLDFAALNGFALSSEAQALVEQAQGQRQGAWVVDVTQLPDTPPPLPSRPDLPMPNNTEIDDALLDDPL